MPRFKLIDRGMNSCQFIFSFNYSPVSIGVQMLFAFTLARDFGREKRGSKAKNGPEFPRISRPLQ
jgi:hypothetical protein